MNKKVLIFLSALLGWNTMQGAETVGKVLLLEGKADAVQTAKTRSLVRQAGVEDVDVVKTAVASSLQIGFKDSTTCTLGASSELSIDEYRYSRKAADASFNATLKEGNVRIVTGDIVKKAPRRFTITTPRASIGIRGCLVQIFTGPKEDRILIFEIGKGRSIEVVTKNGKTRKTVTAPCLVTIGEHGIGTQDLPAASYREGNAALQIAQSGFGDAGAGQNAGYDTRNLNGNTEYLAQMADINKFASTVTTPSSPGQPVQPVEPTYDDIDTLISQARANQLSMVTAGGGSLSVLYTSPDGSSSTFTSAINKGDYSLRFNSSELEFAGSSTPANSAYSIYVTILLSAEYSTIKNGAFTVDPNRAADASIKLPNDALYFRSGNVSLGSSNGKIDTLRGNLNFAGSGTGKLSINTGLANQ